MQSLGGSVCRAGCWRPTLLHPGLERSGHCALNRALKRHKIPRLLLIPLLLCAGDFCWWRMQPLLSKFLNQANSSCGDTSFPHHSGKQQRGSLQDVGGVSTLSKSCTSTWHSKQSPQGTSPDSGTCRPSLRQ